MGANVNRFILSIIGILTVTLSITTSASALSADIAKKCRTMAMKEHPPTRVGAKSGTARAQRDFYRACITNSGTTSDKNPQSTTAQPAK